MCTGRTFTFAGSATVVNSVVVDKLPSGYVMFATIISYFLQRGEGLFYPAKYSGTNTKNQTPLATG
jgi:hypothetical protein